MEPTVRIPERPRHPISAFRRAFALGRPAGPLGGTRVSPARRRWEREKSVRRASLWMSTVAAVAVASALVAAPAANAAPAGQPSIAWGPCTDSTLSGAGAECGYLGVPLDYRKPAGEQIQLAVSRVK